MSCAGVVCSNRALASVCGEHPIALATGWVVWGSHGIPVANKSIRCDSFPVLEALFGDEKCPAGALAPL